MYIKTKLILLGGLRAYYQRCQPPKFKMREIFWGAKGPHSCILMTGGPSDFLGSEILAQNDFFGSMKYAGIFLGRKKKQRDFFGLRKKDQGIFLSMLKKVVIFLGRQILKNFVIFFGYKI